MIGMNLFFVDNQNSKKTEPSPKANATPLKKKLEEIALEKLNKYGLSSKDSLFKFNALAVPLLIKKVTK